MLKAILVKLSLITVAVSFVLSFGVSEAMATKCKKECAGKSGTDRKTCMKDCKEKNKAAGGGKHKKHEKAIDAVAAK